MPKTITYKQALERVELIAAELEKGDTDLDQLAEKLREAREMLAICKSKLLKAEDDIDQILHEDGTRQTP